MRSRRVAITGVHYKNRWQIVAQQTIMRRSNRKVTAEQVKPLARASILADYNIMVLMIMRWFWPRTASIMHHMLRISGQQ